MWSPVWILKIKRRKYTERYQSFIIKKEELFTQLREHDRVLAPGRAVHAKGFERSERTRYPVSLNHLRHRTRGRAGTATLRSTEWSQSACKKAAPFRMQSHCKKECLIVTICIFLVGEGAGEKKVRGQEPYFMRTGFSERDTDWFPF